MRHFCGSVLTVFSLLLAGCAANPNTGGTPAEQAGQAEQIVAQRAQQRIDALMAGEVAESLEYTSPSYRQTSTQSQYAADYAGVANWTEAIVEKVTCEAERCDVRMAVSYRMNAPRAHTIVSSRPVDEVWIRVDGQWYLYL